MVKCILNTRKLRFYESFIPKHRPGTAFLAVSGFLNEFQRGGPGGLCPAVCALPAADRRPDVYSGGHHRSPGPLVAVQLSPQLFPCFPTDSEAELQLLKHTCNKMGVDVAISEVFAKGGDGGIELAQKLLEVLETKEANYKPLYDLDLSKKKLKLLQKKYMELVVLLLIKKQLQK